MQRAERGIEQFRRPARRGAWSRIACALLLAAACLAPPCAANPDPDFTEDEIKAAFLMRFLQFVEWPREARPGPEEPLVVVAFGRERFEAALDPALHAAALGETRVEVRFGNDARDLEGCHVAFLAGLPPSQAEALLRALRGKPVLTVGETPTFLEQGGVIRFFAEQHRVRFEIDEHSARAVGLRISSKLLRLGAARR